MRKLVKRGHDFVSWHTYEKMTPDKRPQDVGRDGSGLRYELSEHGYDDCPEVVELWDAQGRSCRYLVQDRFSEESNRPGAFNAKLSVKTLEHGGEVDDDMPQLLRVTDTEGRSAHYRPIMEDGRVVDSKGFTLQRFDSVAEDADRSESEPA